MPRLRLLTALVLSSTLSACILNVVRRDVEEVPPAPRNVDSALRVFTADGSVVVFSSGAAVGPDRVTGREPGLLFDLHRNMTGNRNWVPLDSVIGMEAFTESTDPGLSFLASVGVTALAIGGTVALACAADPKCFGSCPTVYSYDEMGEHLEAETFSYSISPLLEGRDVDRLAVRANSEGRVELEIRNEALETHFINHLELLEVRHPEDERVLSDVGNRVLSIGELHPVHGVLDRGGRDVTGTVARRDGDAFATAEGRIAAVTPEDDRDWLEFSLPPAVGDSAALVLRLRNSLLSTVLFYEFMLARQGAGALDWMARDVEQIGNAVELGSWFQRTMGLRLEVEEGGGFREVARMGDSGPIAWKEVAFVVPTRRGERTRVRLSFLADEWRIDHLAWSPTVRRPEVLAHPVAEVRPLVGEGSADATALVSEPDEDYLVTTAGTAFNLRFETGAPAHSGSRTFLLSSQGYYSEWVRPEWVRNAESPEPFRPDESLLPELMARWMEVKGPMEDAFHETRIPVR